jgi:hypothetical protein
VFAEELVVASVQVLHHLNIVDDNVGLEEQEAHRAFGVAQVVVINFKGFYERMLILPVECWQELFQVSNERQWKARAFDTVLPRVVPPSRVWSVYSVEKKD